MNGKRSHPLRWYVFHEAYRDLVEGMQSDDHEGAEALVAYLRQVASGMTLDELFGLHPKSDPEQALEQLYNHLTPGGSIDIEPGWQSLAADLHHILSVIDPEYQLYSIGEKNGSLQADYALSEVRVPGDPEPPYPVHDEQAIQRWECEYTEWLGRREIFLATDDGKRLLSQYQTREVLAERFVSSIIERSRQVCSVCGDKGSVHTSIFGTPARTVCNRHAGDYGMYRSEASPTPM